MTLLFALLAATLSEQGAQAMRERRFADAERIYRQMLKETPADPRIAMNLGLALYSASNYSESASVFAKVLAKSSAPGPAHLLLGVSLLKLRQHCNAVPPLEKARQWEASPQVLVELGDAYFGCNRFADAAKTFEALGNTPKALQGAGMSYARQGQSKKAEDAFARLESLPESAEIHELIAEVRALENRHEDALKEIEAARRLNPKDNRLVRLHARALWRTARYTEAREAFEKLAQRWTHDPEFNFERGDTLVRVDGPAAGLPHLQKAVAQAPTLIPARAALGRALVQLNRGAEAIAHLEAAAPQDPTLLMPLSRAYKAAGRNEDAARTEREYRKTQQN